MPRRVPDITKIGQAIGYRPKVHLDEIIEHVVAFWAEGSSPTPAQGVLRAARDYRPVAVAV